MRVRAQTPTGDYRFGNGPADFLVDSAAAVAQRISTRLKLMTGEWFLDVTDGTPYSTEILGAHTKPLYDLAIQERILRTDGVRAIIDYESNLDQVRRALTVTARVQTIFGEEPVTVQEAF